MREDVLEPDDVAVLVEYRLGEGLEPGVFPRLLADTVDDGDGGLPFECLVVGLGTDTLQVLGMEEVVGVCAQKLFGLVAEQAAAGGADVDVASVGLVQAHEVAHLLGEQAEAGLALAQRLLGPLAPGDVPEGDDRADDRPTLPYRGAHVLHGEGGAVLAPEDLVAGGMHATVPEGRVDGTLVLGVGHALCVEVAYDVVLVPPGELARPVAQHPLSRRVDEGGPLVEVKAVDALTSGGQYGTVLADQTFEVLLVLPRLRYILYLAHDVQRPVFRVAHQESAQKDPDGPPALVDVALLGVEVLDLPRQHASESFDDLFEVVGMGDALEIRGEQLFLGVAGDLAYRRVDLQPPSIRGPKRHAERRRAEDGPEPLLALPERLLRQLALRDAPALMRLAGAQHPEGPVRQAG